MAGLLTKLGRFGVVNEIKDSGTYTPTAGGNAQRVFTAEETCPKRSRDSKDYNYSIGCASAARQTAPSPLILRGSITSNHDPPKELQLTTHLRRRLSLYDKHRARSPLPAQSCRRSLEAHGHDQEAALLKCQRRIW